MARRGNSRRIVRRTSDPALPDPTPRPDPVRRVQTVDPTPRPARPPSQRGTFRVAQAQRQLAADLPGVVRSRTGEHRQRQAEAKRTPSAVSMAPPPPVPKREPNRQPDRPTPTQPTLRDPVANCKSRPSSTKGGSGAGRSFVPWCG